jgi:exodeoxyribonuclease V beta subunit
VAEQSAATLDPLRLPLWGSRLVEASAGTGKTWTIAALYLRLVLGHGGEEGHGRALLPAEVLVMTFTRAATRELSDRIRLRLLQAARCFRGDEEPADELLHDLRDAYPPGLARQQAAWRLALAAEAMDDAAVHTIDAWCQRMLREHAFDSGCLFDEELNADERAMQHEAALDYWRQQVYPLQAEAFDAVQTVWPDAAALERDATALARFDIQASAGQGSLADCLAQAQTARSAAVAALKAGWRERAEAFRAWLDAQIARKDCPFNRQKLQARRYGPWLDTLAAWAEGPDTDPPDLKSGKTRLLPTGLAEAAAAGAQVQPPPESAALAQLLQDLAALPKPAAALRLHAAARVAQRLAELKQQAGSFGFADMLMRLDEALDPARHGAAALRLRERIVAQTPVALVDEFQDTSPVQARIFDRLYRIADNDRATALLLIGDPKQAIYAFRGADIHSYLQVRRATAGRHYALGTNYRSTAALVAAVNYVFMRAEAEPGGGAFQYRDAATGESALPFVAVAARGRAETFVTAAGPGPALRLEMDAMLRDSDGQRRHFAARCAERIAVLLSDTAAGFDEPGQPHRPLRPADIAVLVRTGKEAAAVRLALRRRGVASVYLSDRDSVFDSDEARDLLLWLRAVAAPRDVRSARAALATASAGLPLTELAHLASDDAAFDERCAQLRQWQAVWQGQGVLALVRQMLHGLDLPARWLAEDGGERRLTNLLHLAELLQAASAQLDGEQALIRWLAAQVSGEAGRGDSGDAQIMRLESDADLVKVVTVHKAKGLEYPLVFLPFASLFRGADASRTRFVKLVDEDGRQRLQLQPTADDVAAADRERLREDLRLLYVALTRARHALWVGLGALKIGNNAACQWHRSAIGILLTGPAPVPATDLWAGVQAAVQGAPDIALVQAPDSEPCTRVVARDTALPLRPLRPYTASFERRWTVGSFSALVRALDASLPLAAMAAAARDDEPAGPDVAALPPTATPPAAAAPWHVFPRGAQPGNFLHDQLEWLAGEGFALADSPLLQQQLLRRCERQGYVARAPEVLDWLTQAVNTPLPPLGAPLSGLDSLLPEMEFWLPSAGLAAADVDALCRQHLLPGHDRPALPERELRGMLMGFADLVFEHGGRWWVLDYKSNHLGTRDADYHAQALQGAMAVHRYDVQAALYLLALHRLLRSRLGEHYQPERQLGGAVYYFLRGLHGPERGCCVVPPSLPLLQALDGLLREPA